MKNVKLIALFAALIVTASVFPVLVHGDTNTDPTEITETDAPTYSPDEDPLVSLSYINEVIKPEYDKKIEELTAEAEKLSESVYNLQTALSDANKKIEQLSEAEPTNGGIGQYEVVYLQQGAKLMAKTPCEIILRTGSAIAVSIISNGLNDITDGTEILNANPIPLYHALIVPRGDDGRGIEITSADAYVMVRGEYEIVQ